MRKGRCEMLNRRFGISRAALVVASTLLANGCSFALLEAAPDQGYSRRSQVTCTESYALPVVDTAIAAAAAGGAVASFAKEPSDDGVSKVPYTLAGVAAVVAAMPFLMSAVYGYVEVADCHAAAAGAVGQSGAPPDRRQVMER